MTSRGPCAMSVQQQCQEGVVSRKRYRSGSPLRRGPPHLYPTMATTPKIGRSTQIRQSKSAAYINCLFLRYIRPRTLQPWVRWLTLSGEETPRSHQWHPWVARSGRQTDKGARHRDVLAVHCGKDLNSLSLSRQPFHCRRPGISMHAGTIEQLMWGGTGRQMQAVEAVWAEDGGSPES